MSKFTFYKQSNEKDCGPTCLKMISKYYGKTHNIQSLRTLSGFNKQGTSLLGISESAEILGFRTKGIKTTIDKLDILPTPCILYWQYNHFVVLLSTHRSKAKIADPRIGIVDYDIKDFATHWIKDSQKSTSLGIALLLEPTSKFYSLSPEQSDQKGFRRLISYLTFHKHQFIQIFISLFVLSAIQLAFPFLTQIIVDVGINTKNLKFVIIVLIAQLVLTFSKTIIDFIRSKILLRIASQINMRILSDFWMKVTKLPISHFDTHQIGDTLQRINDIKQIRNFSTGSTINTLFSFVTFIIYAIILILYQFQLFLIFIIGSMLYILWILFFLKLRRKVNYESFRISAIENSASLELIQAMQEIRLNNAEKIKRWSWEAIQASLYKINFKVLSISQWQQAGATLITQVQDVFLTFSVATLVIDGKITLGSMIAVQYIVGQLSVTVNQWISFSQSMQDAKISLERIDEIHSLDNEETNDNYLNFFPDTKSIYVKDLSFSYPNNSNKKVLSNINIFIPEKKITAIVGTSGSGKTTLLKILLMIYHRYDGNIFTGAELQNGVVSQGQSFKTLKPATWRERVGVIMQDGFIFDDTILNNIAISHSDVNYQRLEYSCKVANIYDFISNLPNGFNTKVGASGVGLSQGQKQRILIARVVYKDPDFVFMDEATNALDANNEKIILDNLSSFLKDKTVLIVAHRLSTVKNADQIIVIDNGCVVEIGSHDLLTSQRGRYYDLVKNQLELGL